MEFDPNSNPPCYKTMDEVSGKEEAREREEGISCSEGEHGLGGGV